MKTSANRNTPAFQPLYRQIKALITDSLVSGEWRPGDLIPSEMELASRFSVSQGTVRKAIGELAHQNLLGRQQGKGTFVASHSEERSKFPYLRITPDRGALDEVEARLIDCRKVKLDAASGKKLGLAPGTSAYLIKRVMTISGKKVICEELRPPATRFKRLPADTTERPHSMLPSKNETQFGASIAHGEEKTKPLPGVPAAASNLGVVQKTPLLVI